MNRQVLGGFTVLLLLMALGAMLATAQPVVLRATIPFDFYLGDKAMPAGDYAVETGIGISQTLKLRDVDGKVVAYFATFPVDATVKGHGDELVFQRYNDQYFLSSVWRADSPLGQEIPASRHEKLLRASLETPGVKVFIASAR